MTGPSPEERRVPPYVALVRIGAVVGMSTAAAFGIFFLVGGASQAGLIALAITLPFFFVMRLVEQAAGPPDTPPQT